MSKSKENPADLTSARRIKKDRHKSFKLEKRIKPSAPKLPSIWKLSKSSLITLSSNWKLFSGIVLIYGLLSVFLVYSFNIDAGVTDTKKSLDEALSGSFSELATSISLFIHLFQGASANDNQAGSVYQFILIIIISLALIWALRQVYAKNKVRIRDAFYQGMYPLVTFLIVLAVAGLQLIPAIIGAFLYGQVASNGIATTSAEIALWAGVAIVLATISLYMISSSLFALYVVCLPNMTPWRALRSARDLVRYRRWTVMRKVVFLPIALVIAEALVVIPILMFATPLAPWVFLILSMTALAVSHSYIYQLYRSLL